MPQLSFPGPQPTISTSKRSSCTSTPAVSTSTSSGTSASYSSRRFSSSMSSSCTPGSSQVSPSSVFTHTFMPSGFPWSICSLAIKNFCTISFHPQKVEASVFRWKPLASAPGFSATNRPFFPWTGRSCQTPRRTISAADMLRTWGTARSILLLCSVNIPSRSGSVP